MAAHHDMKRVSFGQEDDVKIIMYDDGFTNSTPTFRRSTSPPDNTLNRVLVTTQDVEIPRPISPPAQIIEEYPPPAVSPPLPSLVRKMEHESDNPFRPEETLYHEVDPIVKAYSTMPYYTTSSPVPTPDLTPIKNGRHVTLEHNSVTVIDGAPKGAIQSPQHNTTSTFDTSTPQKQNLLRHQGNGSHEIPPPNNVELVHVDAKKKKCACCSVQ